MNSIKGDPRKQKAVALAICIKNVCGRQSTIYNYTPNKIHAMTGVHPNTFKSLLPTLIELGIIQFDGANKEHMVIKRLHSTRKARNINVHYTKKTYTEIYKGLRAFLFLMIQKRKDFIKRTLQIVHNPTRWDDFRRARKTVKRLVCQGILRDTDFKEYGISYKRIAKELGNCIRTAQRVVTYAIEQNWCEKTQNFIRYNMKGVNYREVYGLTFTTRNYGFVVNANTYRLSIAW